LKTYKYNRLKNVTTIQFFYSHHPEEYVDVLSTFVHKMKNKICHIVGTGPNPMKTSEHKILRFRLFIDCLIVFSPQCDSNTNRWYTAASIR